MKRVLALVSLLLVSGLNGQSIGPSTPNCGNTQNIPAGAYMDPTLTNPWEGGSFFQFQNLGLANYPPTYKADGFYCQNVVCFNGNGNSNSQKYWPLGSGEDSSIQREWICQEWPTSNCAPNTWVYDPSFGGCGRCPAGCTASSFRNLSYVDTNYDGLRCNLVQCNSYTQCYNITHPNVNGPKYAWDYGTATQAQAFHPSRSGLIPSTSFTRSWNEFTSKYHGCGSTTVSASNGGIPAADYCEDPRVPTSIVVDPSLKEWYMKGALTTWTQTLTQIPKGNSWHPNNVTGVVAAENSGANPEFTCSYSVCGGGVMGGGNHNWTQYTFTYKGYEAKPADQQARILAQCGSALSECSATPAYWRWDWNGAASAAVNANVNNVNFYGCVADYICSGFSCEVPCPGGQINGTAWMTRTLRSGASECLHVECGPTGLVNLAYPQLPDGNLNTSQATYAATSGGVVDRSWQSLVTTNGQASNSCPPAHVAMNNGGVPQYCTNMNTPGRVTPGISTRDFGSSLLSIAPGFQFGSTSNEYAYGCMYNATCQALGALSRCQYARVTYEDWSGYKNLYYQQSGSSNPYCANSYRANKWVGMTERPQDCNQGNSNACISASATTTTRRVQLDCSGDKSNIIPQPANTYQEDCHGNNQLKNAQENYYKCLNNYDYIGKVFAPYQCYGTVGSASASGNALQAGLYYNQCDKVFGNQIKRDADCMCTYVKELHASQDLTLSGYQYAAKQMFEDMWMNYAYSPKHLFGELNNYGCEYGPWASGVGTNGVPMCDPITGATTIKLNQTWISVEVSLNTQCNMLTDANRKAIITNWKSSLNGYVSVASGKQTDDLNNYMQSKQVTWTDVTDAATQAKTCSLRLNRILVTSYKGAMSYADAVNNRNMFGYKQSLTSTFNNGMVKVDSTSQNVQVQISTSGATSSTQVLSLALILCASLVTMLLM